MRLNMGDNDVSTQTDSWFSYEGGGGKGLFVYIIAATIFIEAGLEWIEELLHSFKEINKEATSDIVGEMSVWNCFLW